MYIAWRPFMKTSEYAKHRIKTVVYTITRNREACNYRKEGLILAVRLRAVAYGSAIRQASQSIVSKLT